MKVPGVMDREQVIQAAVSCHLGGLAMVDKGVINGDRQITNDQWWNYMGVGSINCPGFVSDLLVIFLPLNVGSGVADNWWAWSISIFTSSLCIDLLHPHHYPFIVVLRWPESQQLTPPHLHANTWALILTPYSALSCCGVIWLVTLYLTMTTVLTWNMTLE